MADREQRENSGVLFKNEKKTADTPNWGDYTGHIRVEGEDFWLTAWIKEGQKGKFMSLSVKRKDAPKAQGSTAKPQPTKPPEEDDVPF